MNRAVRYALGLLVEEMGEALCHIGRALRFGIDTLGQDGVSERHGLSSELGDVMAAIDYATTCKVADAVPLTRRAGFKLAKLLNPESVDNLGRRLAPDPAEARMRTCRFCKCTRITACDVPTDHGSRACAWVAEDLCDHPGCIEKAIKECADA